MKYVLVIALVIYSQLGFGQLKPGFSAFETRNMIALCNSFSYLEMYGNDEDIIPEGFSKIHTSKVIGMDNKFQVYISEDVGVINFRGSTDKKESWLENFLTAMIPATGEMVIDGVTIPYQFSTNHKAAVHAGYALEVVLLMNDIENQINRLNDEYGIDQIILTGHSQGGALAQLIRSGLEIRKGTSINQSNIFKTYAFASPKIGNQEFTIAYNLSYCTGWSFNIINREDLIPKLPMPVKEGSVLTAEKLINVGMGVDSIDWGEAISIESMNRFERTISSILNSVGDKVTEQIGKTTVDVELPNYVEDINYGINDSVIQIPSISYPLILKDSTNFKDADGKMNENNLEYKKEPTFYQHKLYNYYVTILKVYFPEEYAVLKKKCSVCN